MAHAPLSGVIITAAVLASAPRRCHVGRSRRPFHVGSRRRRRARGSRRKCGGNTVSPRSVSRSMSPTRRRSPGHGGDAQGVGHDRWYGAPRGYRLEVSADRRTRRGDWALTLATHLTAAALLIRWPHALISGGTPARGTVFIASIARGNRRLRCQPRPIPRRSPACSVWLARQAPASAEHGIPGQLGVPRVHRRARWRGGWGAGACVIFGHWFPLAPCRRARRHRRRPSVPLSDDASFITGAEIVVDGGVAQNGVLIMSGVFEGLQVVDLTEGFAGRLCTMMLGDNGASVIRVVPRSDLETDADPAATSPARANGTAASRYSASTFVRRNRVPCARRCSTKPTWS